MKKSRSRKSIEGIIAFSVDIKAQKTCAKLFLGISKALLAWPLEEDLPGLLLWVRNHLWYLV
jgi:hypothetical protein